MHARLVEEELQVTKNENPSKNVTKSNLDISANIFTYISFCPSFQLLSFYRNLFDTSSTKNISLALLSILKSSLNAEKETSTEVFQKIMQKFGFSYDINDLIKNLQMGFDDNLGFKTFLKDLYT